MHIHFHKAIPTVVHTSPGVNKIQFTDSQKRLQNVLLKAPSILATHLFSEFALDSSPSHQTFFGTLQFPSPALPAPSLCVK
uniref:Ovule protein n=1 Tax=Steinernema glaseri TaxID=37863 RepID=A0A1I8A1N8_9BILA